MAPSWPCWAVAGCGGTASPVRAIQHHAAFVALPDNDFFFPLYFFPPKMNGNGPMAEALDATAQSRGQSRGQQEG